MKQIYEKRGALRNQIERIRDQRLDLLRDQIRVMIKTTIANLSSTQTAIIEPALLRISFEGQENDIQLYLGGSRFVMKAFGMEMSGGPPRSTIEEHSYEQITFVTPTASDLGSEWELVKKALVQPHATAKIFFYTIDGTINESPSFPFSADFANQQTKERLKALER